MEFVRVTGRSNVRESPPLKASVGLIEDLVSEQPLNIAPESTTTGPSLQDRNSAQSEQAQPPTPANYPGFVDPVPQQSLPVNSPLYFDDLLKVYDDPVLDFSRFMDMVSSDFDWSTMNPGMGVDHQEVQPIVPVSAMLSDQTNVTPNHSRPRVPDGATDNGVHNPSRSVPGQTKDTDLR